MDYSKGHGFQGGPLGPGAGVLGAQAWAPGWQTAQSADRSTDEGILELNQEFQRSYGAGPSGAGAPGRFLRPDLGGAELTTRSGQVEEDPRGGHSSAQDQVE